MARYAHENEMLGGFEIVWHSAEPLAVPKTGEKRQRLQGSPLYAYLYETYSVQKHVSGKRISAFVRCGHLFILVRSCDTVGTYPLSYMLDLIHLCGSEACDPDLSIIGGNRCKCLRI